MTRKTAAEWIGYGAERLAETLVRDLCDRGAARLPVAVNAREMEIKACTLAITELAMASMVIRSLKRGDCWCDMAIGHPLIKSHSEACLSAQQFMEGE